MTLTSDPIELEISWQSLIATVNEQAWELQRCRKHSAATLFAGDGSGRTEPDPIRSSAATPVELRT